MSELRLPPFRIIHAAYVTGDIERGKRRLAQMFGVREVKRYPRNGVQVPGGEAVIDVAIADAGGTAVEVIQPVGGLDDVYRRAVPTDPAEIAFHHYASRIKDQSEWDMVMGAIDQHGFDTPVRGEAPGVKYVYIDTRKNLGHILEYIWFTAPEAEAGMDTMTTTEVVSP
jgi:hypothetical protein